MNSICNKINAEKTSYLWRKNEVLSGLTK